MELKDIITTIIAVLAFIISVSSFIMSHKKAKAEAVIAYLAEGDSERMRNRRAELYKHEKELQQKDFQNKIISYYKKEIDVKCDGYDEIKEIEKNITDEVAFYDKWAILINRRYVSQKVIDENRAKVFLHVYEIVEFYIKLRQEENNYYASDMTKLYNKLTKN